jgi:hypothetical protein
LGQADREGKKKDGAGEIKEERMKKTVYFLVAVICTSCATPEYTIKHNETNDIDGHRVYDMLYLKNTLLSVGKNAADYFYLTRLKYDNKNPVYGFYLDGKATEWRFINTLKLKIDNDEVIVLIDKDPTRNVVTSQWLEERPVWPLQDNILKKLASCETLTFQYEGERYSSGSITIPPEGITAIKNFIN